MANRKMFEPGTRIMFKSHVRALKSLTKKERTQAPVGPVIHDREIGVIVSLADEHIAIVNVRDTTGLIDVNDTVVVPTDAHHVLVDLTYLAIKE